MSSTCLEGRQRNMKQSVVHLSELRRKMEETFDGGTWNRTREPLLYLRRRSNQWSTPSQYAYRTSLFIPTLPFSRGLIFRTREEWWKLIMLRQQEKKSEPHITFSPHESWEKHKAREWVISKEIGNLRKWEKKRKFVQSPKLNRRCSSVVRASAYKRSGPSSVEYFSNVLRK